MKAGRDYAWYVSYCRSFVWYDAEIRKWVATSDSDSGRFCCRKKDIKKEVNKRVTEELEGLIYHDLEITILDKYSTTPTEL